MEALHRVHNTTSNNLSIGNLQIPIGGSVLVPEINEEVNSALLKGFVYITSRYPSLQALEEQTQQELLRRTEEQDREAAEEVAKKLAEEAEEIAKKSAKEAEDRAKKQAEEDVKQEMKLDALPPVIPIDPTPKGIIIPTGTLSDAMKQSAGVTEGILSNDKV